MREILRMFAFLTAVACIPQAHSATTTAYNTFLDAPQRSGQEPGFGYYGGKQVTSTVFGVSFVPTITGNVSDLWIAVGSSLSDVGTDIFELYLATAGSQLEPDSVFAFAEVQGELSKGESVVHISADQPDIFIEQGVMYWMLIAPGAGTPQVGWLGGPPNSPAGSYSTYLDPQSSTGWWVTTINANGAMRIDVSPVPEPSAFLLFLAGLSLVLLRALACRKQLSN